MTKLSLYIREPYPRFLAQMKSLKDKCIREVYVLQYSILLVSVYISEVCVSIRGMCIQKVCAFKRNWGSWKWESEGLEGAKSGILNNLSFWNGID